MTGPSSRMLDLLSLLQVRRDWSGAILAERLEVTTRTVRRDVDRLRELGYRIRTLKGPDGGYRLEAGSELPPLKFDDEQAVAIALALQTAPLTGVDTVEASDRALATIRQLMPSRLRTRIDAVNFSTIAGDEQVAPHIVEAISTAIRDGMVLRFDYGQAQSAAPPRRVEPLDLVARRGRWYLVAWDLDAADWRIFRADRLRPRTPTGPRFTPRPLPGGSAATYLAARFKGADESDEWPCIGEFDIDVPLVEAVPWILDGHAEALTEMSCRVTLGSWSWAGLLALILRFDAPFRIRGPEELIDAALIHERRLKEARS